MDAGGTLTLASPGWLLPAALILAAAVAALAWGYRRAPAGRVAAALKVTGLGLLALCLVEPALVSQRAKPGANLFVVLADNSRGMNLRDRGASESRGEILRAELGGDRPWLTRLAESYQLRRYLFDARLRRSGIALRVIGATGDAESDAARAAQHREDRRLQQRQVVALDPELVNVVWHPKGQVLFVRLNKLDRLEPAVERVGADLPADAVGNALPDRCEILFHK